MPKLTRTAPRLGLHKNSGQGIVRIDGRMIYLGRYGTPECQANYDRIIAEWMAAGRKLPAVEQADDDYSINHLILEFWRFAQKKGSGLFFRSNRGQAMTQGAAVVDWD